MERAPQNVLNSAPGSSNANHSALASIPTKTNPSYELWRKEDIDQSTAESKSKGESGNKSAARLIMVLITFLVLVTLTLVALSVATYKQLRSEHTQFLHQLQANNNVSPQLCYTQSDVLQILTQLDARIMGHSEIQSHCGAGLWWQMAYLNMTDPSQQCPFAWREYNSSGVRACGRQPSSTGSCSGIVLNYFASQPYSRVCGRVIGYQVRSPDAFNFRFDDEIKLDGISVTYGIQRNHIWSFAAGLYELLTSNSSCPCSNEQVQRMPPPLIGDNYYCESGNPDNSWRLPIFYQNDPLWDGQQCEGTCCNGTNTPPWFSVQLPAPTTDAIEVSICADESTTNEDTPVELIEIYVQ